MHVLLRAGAVKTTRRWPKRRMLRRPLKMVTRMRAGRALATTTATHFERFSDRRDRREGDVTTAGPARISRGLGIVVWRSGTRANGAVIPPPRDLHLPSWSEPDAAGRPRAADVHPPAQVGDRRDPPPRVVAHRRDAAAHGDTRDRRQQFHAGELGAPRLRPHPRSRDRHLALAEEGLLRRLEYGGPRDVVALRVLGVAPSHLEDRSARDRFQPDARPAPDGERAGHRDAVLRADQPSDLRRSHHAVNARAVGAGEEAETDDAEERGPVDRRLAGRPRVARPGP